MRTVLKYRLHLTFAQVLMLAADAVLLDVKEQKGVLCLWAETTGRIIDTATAKSVTVYMVATGADVPSDAVRYVCTVQVDNNGEILVVHIYEGPRA